MVDDHDLEGLDPYDLMATETARLDHFFGAASAATWDAASRCEGWSVRDVLAHLAASEDYNRACLDGTVQDFLADLGAKGAVDLASANDLGVHDFDGQAPGEILATWRERSASNREAIRARRRRRRQQCRRVSGPLAGVPSRVRARDPCRRCRCTGRCRRGGVAHRLASTLRPLRDSRVEARPLDRFRRGAHGGEGRRRRHRAPRRGVRPSRRGTTARGIEPRRRHCGHAFGHSVVPERT